MTSSQPTTWRPDPRTAARLPLLRPRKRRLIAGVCRGVSLHLGVHVAWVRLIAVALCACYGAGALGYVLLWVLVPVGDPIAAAQATAKPGSIPDYTGLADSGDAGHESRSSNTPADMLRHASKPGIIAAIGIICLMVAALLQSAGNNVVPMLCVALALAGVAIPWIRFRQTGGQFAATAIGMALVFAAYALVMVESALTTGTVSLPRSVVTGLALVLCVGAAVIPWVSSLVRDVGEERALKEREEERADMTAHLHDGVLQTLALIQTHPQDAGYVASLARSQERELRNWLYQEHVASDRSVSAGIRVVAGQVEDAHGVAVDVVTVGDARPSEQTDALLDAAMQAIVNAVTHGRPPVTVYCEAGERLVEIDVRDHGDGFDPDRIPEGRLGIRESIMGRVRRRGGDVEIVSRPGWGTEVRMTMPTGNGDATNREQDERDRRTT